MSLDGELIQGPGFRQIDPATVMMPPRGGVAPFSEDHPPRSSYILGDYALLKLESGKLVRIMDELHEDLEHVGMFKNNLTSENLRQAGLRYLRNPRLGRAIDGIKTDRVHNGTKLFQSNYLLDLPFFLGFVGSLIGTDLSRDEEFQDCAWQLVLNHRTNPNYLVTVREYFAFDQHRTYELDKLIVDKSIEKANKTFTERESVSSYSGESTSLLFDVHDCCNAALAYARDLPESYRKAAVEAAIKHDQAPGSLLCWTSGEIDTERLDRLHETGYIARDDLVEILSCNIDTVCGTFFGRYHETQDRYDALITAYPELKSGVDARLPELAVELQ